MPDVSKRIITVHCPANRPELRTAFAALASKDGFLQYFTGRDSETGEQVIVAMDVHPEPPLGMEVA